MFPRKAYGAVELTSPNNWNLAFSPRKTPAVVGPEFNPIRSDKFDVPCRVLSCNSMDLVADTEKMENMNDEISAYRTEAFLQFMRQFIHFYSYCIGKLGHDHGMVFPTFG